MDFVKLQTMSLVRMGQWSSTDLALQILSEQEGEAPAAFALNALGKSSLSVSIPIPAFLPAFAALFHAFH